MIIRTFLINPQLNERGWRVNLDTLYEKVKSFLDKPLILRKYPDGRVDHERWDNLKSVEANFLEQAKYKIGKLIRILKHNEKDDYYADIEITNKDAASFLAKYKDGKIPLSVSPQIIYDTRKNPNEQDIKEWFGSHLAIVQKGAYGPDAIATNFCDGDSSACFKQFDLPLSASALPDNVLETLEEISSLDASSENPEHSIKMIEVTSTNTPVTNPTTSNTNPGAPIPQKEAPYVRDVNPSETNQPQQTDNSKQQEQEQKTDFQKAYEELKAKYDLEIQSKTDLVSQHEKSLNKLLEERKFEQIRNAIPIYLDDFIDKNGEVDQARVDEKAKYYLKKGWTAEDVAERYEGEIKLFMNSIPTNANTQSNAPSAAISNSASGVAAESPCSSKSASFPIPNAAATTTESKEASGETPWFAKLAYQMAGRGKTR